MQENLAINLHMHFSAFIHYEIVSNHLEFWNNRGAIAEG